METTPVALDEAPTMDPLRDKNPWPARLDVAQSLSGLLLALFMWGHMLFVSSILLGERAMWTVTRFFEGYFLFGRSYPVIVSVFVALIIILFALHGVLALRKVPQSYSQWRAFKAHKVQLRHGDTTLWWLQVVTGFALLVLATAHLAQMLLHPGDIGPQPSSDRVWNGRWWVLYLILLPAVELHGGIGLYRLALKWVTFNDRQSQKRRKQLKLAKWAFTGFFITLGLASLAAYMKIGYEHRYEGGETPSVSQVEEVSFR